jgi:hypothetical protein
MSSPFWKGKRMPLVEIGVLPDASPMPLKVAAFLEEAERRIEAFQRDAEVPGFVASDYVGAYRLLSALVRDHLTSGRLFCEWGSGFGVVAALASIVGFEACGIEIEPILVAQARRLAEDFALPVHFLEGSYLPPGSTKNAPRVDYSWLDTREYLQSDGAMLDPGDFDVIFAYPWPDELAIAERVFERRGRKGALLATFNPSGAFCIRRRVGK